MGAECDEFVGELGVGFNDFVEVGEEGVEGDGMDVANAIQIGSDLFEAFERGL